MSIVHEVTNSSLSLCLSVSLSLSRERERENSRERALGCPIEIAVYYHRLVSDAKALLLLVLFFVAKTENVWGARVGAFSVHA